MAEVVLDLSLEAPIPEDDDPEVLAAIEQGQDDVRHGRVYSLEEVRLIVSQWRLNSSSPKDS